MPDVVRYGHMEQYPVGSTFTSRKELYDCGVHPASQGGIAWAGGGNYSRACSIVVRLGEYGDDRDRGDTLWYTGAGGRPDRNGQLQEDQKWDWRGNKNLLKCQQKKKPVRVIRGAPIDRTAREKPNSSLYPRSGFRYDGLYMVTKALTKRSTYSQYQICTFKLKRLKDQPPAPYPHLADLEEDSSDSDDSKSHTDEMEVENALLPSPVLTNVLLEQLDQMGARSTSTNGPSNDSASTSRTRLDMQPAGTSGGPVRTVRRSTEIRQAGFDPHSNETSQQRRRRNAIDMARRNRLAGLPRISRNN